MSQSKRAAWVELVIAWTWVGVPLAWGVLQTFHKAAALFDGH
jgi:hypothetical protein